MAERHSVKTILFLTAAAVLFWAIVAFGLGILLPFLFGYLAARLAEPLVTRLDEHSPLPRWLCSGLCVGALLLVVGSALFFLARGLCAEAFSFARRLPKLLASFSEPLAQLRDWLIRLVRQAPDGLGTALEGWVRRLFESGSIFAEKLSEMLFSAVSGLIGALPDLLLFTVTAILASFMTSSYLPALRQSLKRRLPPKWLAQAGAVWQRLKHAMGGWLRAQILMMGVTFGILSIGLLWLRVEFPLLFAGLIALIDALPVFGTGTVLLPWALLSFLQRENGFAIGLLVLYGTAAITRTTLEPRIIGKQLGLNPLLTLLALYAGFKLCGVGGMILFPMGAILLRQFLDLLDKSAFPKD